MSKTRYFQNCLGVFQGGGVKAVAYAGAYEEAINRSVFFSELIGASAGSVIAVLIGAGIKPDQLNKFLEEIKFTDFLRQPIDIPNLNFHWAAKCWTPKSWETAGHLKTFSRYLGLHDGSYIGEWINEKLKSILGVTHDPTFSDLYIPTSVIATDLKNRTTVLWNSHTTPDFKVAVAVQASCLMPFFFQPHENRYVDGGMLSNLPSYLLKPATIFDKILAFGFENESPSDDFKSCKDYFFSLVSTVVDGAVGIQLALQENIHTISIDTVGIKSTDFKLLNKQLVEKLVGQGRQAAKAFFDNESSLEFKYRKRDDVAIDIFESFNLLLNSMFNNPTEILLCDDNPAWMYSLFPLLLKWKQDRVEVNVLLKKNGESETHRQYKIRLLEMLGFGIQEVDIIPFRGFIIDGFKKNGNAIVLSDQETQSVHSTILEGRLHFEIIKILREKFNSTYNKKSTPAQILTVETTCSLLPELKKIWQYSDSVVTIAIEEIEISKLTFLTKFVKGYKYRQVDELFKLYNKNRINLFEPVLLKFEQGKFSYVTPPIIEVHSSGSVVIEGNARFLYAYKNNIPKLKAIIVKGVTEDLPSSGRYSINQLLISDRDVRGSDRYDNFKPDLYRKIEQTIHDPVNSLT